MKKIIAITLLITMMLGTFTFTARAEEWFERTFNRGVLVKNDNGLYCYAQINVNGESEWIKILDDVKSFHESVGSSAKAVLMLDGRLLMWGRGCQIPEYDAYGNELLSKSIKGLPVEVLRDVVQFEFGMGFAAALTSDGILWMWGENSKGEFGVGLNNEYTGTHYQPVAIAGNVKKISIGKKCTAILAYNDSLWVTGDIIYDEYWSYAESRRIDNSIKYGEFTLVDTNVKDMDIQGTYGYKNYHNAYVKKDGSLWTFGDNTYGQLGVSKGQTPISATPVHVMNDVERVWAREHKTFALKSDGSFYGWGLSMGEKSKNIDVPRWLAEDVVSMMSNNVESMSNNYVIYRNGCIAEPGAQLRSLSNITGVKIPEDAYMPVKIMYNGSRISTLKAPIVENGRVLAPLRAVFEALGATVTWVDETRSIISESSNGSITLQIDSSEATINGQTVAIDAPPRLSGEYTMVPVRLISEAFGLNVAWDEATQTVSITSEK